MVPGSNDRSSDDEWRYSVEDVSDDEATTDEGSDDDATADDGSIFGPRPDEGTAEVRPGHPDAENALFVVLGVATTLFLVLAMVGLL